VTRGESENTKRWPARNMKQFCVSLSPCLVVSLFWLAAGCDLPGRPNPADRPVPADQILDFGVLYRQNCAGCHGSEGKLGPAPPLNDPLFRAVVTEAELEDVLTNGRKKALMPAFAQESGGVLTAVQIQVLENEIKGIPYRIIKKEEAGVAQVEVVPDAGGISPRWGLPGKTPKGAPPYREPAASSMRSGAGNKERGALVFARACAACHGDHGQGVKQRSEIIRTINDPVFLALISNQALRRFVITGRPDFGMPGYAEARQDNPRFVPLTDKDITDLVALLASWRKDK